MASAKNKSNDDAHVLTEHELEVLRFVAKGYTYDFIADKMFVSNDTVKKHMSNIFKKLRVKNKIEAINKSREWL